MEIKLLQELASVDHKTLFLVFFDLMKAYNNVDRGRLIRTLEGYGDGPQMCNILVTFWVHQGVVTRQNGYHVPEFKSNRGTKKSGLISLTLFIVVLDNVVGIWLAMTAKYQTVAQEGLGLNVGI